MAAASMSTRGAGQEIAMAGSEVLKEWNSIIH